MKCYRIGGCLKIHCGPNTRCLCDDAREQQTKENRIERRKHLGDIEFVNQHGRENASHSNINAE